jgi:uncharacterized membrane protein YhaH (DUF805 family)
MIPFQGAVPYRYTFAIGRGAEMNFPEAIKSGFSNYANFRGRACRSELYWWAIFLILGSIVAALLDLFGDSKFLGDLFSLATFIPNLAVIARRIHDIDRTGWWKLLIFTFFGLFVVIYWACQRGTSGPNRFGPEPFAKLGPHESLTPR